jgi:hypothetical protein
MPVTTFKPLGKVVPGTTRVALFISNKALTSNVATLTTNASHGLAVGDLVEVAGVDSVFDGTWTVATVPTGTTFTYARTNTNVGTVAVSPVAPAWKTHSLGGVAASNKLAVNGLVTLTVASHTFVAGDWVYVNVGDSTIDGLRKVWSVPSATLVCFKVSGASIASVACLGGVSKVSSAWATLFGPVAASTSEVMSTIAICNGGEYAANVRLALATSTSPTTVERIIHDSSVAAGDTIFVTIGLAADTGKHLMVQSNQPDVTFSASTAETA